MKNSCFLNFILPALGVFIIAIGLTFTIYFNVFVLIKNFHAMERFNEIVDQIEKELKE